MARPTVHVDGSASPWRRRIRCAVAPRLPRGRGPRTRPPITPAAAPSPPNRPSPCGTVPNSRCGPAQHAAGIRQPGHATRGNVALTYARTRARALPLSLAHTVGGPGQGEGSDHYRVQDAKGSQDSLLRRRNGHAGADCAAVRPRGCDRGGGERRRAGHGSTQNFTFAQHVAIFAADSPPSLNLVNRHRNRNLNLGTEPQPCEPSP